MGNTGIAAIIGGDYRNWSRYRNVLISGSESSNKTEFILGEFLGYCSESGKKLLYIPSSSSKAAEAEAIISALPNAEKSAVSLIPYQEFARRIRKYTYISINYGYEIANAAISSSTYGNYFAAEINPVLFGSIFPAGVNTPAGSYTSWEKLKVQYHERRQSAKTGAYSFVCTFSYGKYSTFSEVRNSLGFLPSSYDYVIIDDINDVFRDGTFSYDAADIMKMLLYTTPSRCGNVFLTSIPLSADRTVSDILDYHIRLYFPSNTFRSYIQPHDFGNIVPAVITSNTELAQKIKESENEKWLILTDSNKRGQKLSNRLKELGIASDFICRENRRQSRKNAAENVQCIITASLSDENFTMPSERFANIAVSTFDNTEFISLISGSFTDNTKQTKLYVFERSQKELSAHRNKLAEKQLILDEAERLAYNVGSHFADEWQKFHFISKYCNNRRLFDKISGIIRFTSNGIELNTVALYKNRSLLMFCGEVLGNAYFEGSLARAQLSLIGSDYHTENPFLTRITNLLESKKGQPMDNAELKALKIQLNEIIQKINTLSIYPMKKVNETSATSVLNEWLCGAGMRYGITTGIAEKHNKKRSYTIVALDEEQFSAFDKACHSKYYPHIPYENREKK